MRPTFGLAVFCGLIVGATPVRSTQSDRRPSADLSPVVVVETSKGTFAFETYPVEAPKTVAHVVELV